MIKEFKLKPCPFCGGEAELFKDISFSAESGKQIAEIKAFAWCCECSALVSGDTEIEAVELWNRRANTVYSERLEG